MANKAKQGDSKGYLWTADLLDRLRINVNSSRVPSLISRTVIGVDPVSSFENDGCGDEVGIVVVSYGSIDGNGYLFKDLSGTHTPEKWGKIVVEEVWEQQRSQHGNECLVVGEENFGGSMVKTMIEGLLSESENAGVTATYKNVIATRQNEIIEYGAISALYHLHKVWHVGDYFQELEQQLCRLKPNEKSKNRPEGESFCRANALIFAMTELHRSIVNDPEKGPLPMGVIT